MRLFRKNRSLQISTIEIYTCPTNYPYYELKNLEQGSKEWIQWRKGVIGASEAPTIMKENPWQSSQNLFDEKLGLKPEFMGNAATREGQRLEEEARLALMKKFKMDLTPTVIQDGEVPYFAASIDAIDKRHSQVFEIKCGAKAYEVVSITKKVPNYYYGQLQHILMVTQLDKIIYAAYRPNSKLIILEIKRSDPYISKLRAAEHKFALDLKKRGHTLQSEFKGSQITRE